MKIDDPYYSVQDEILKSIKETNVLFDNWQSSEDFKQKSTVSNQLRQKIRSIEWDLEDLQDTVMIAERTPDRFNLQPNDINARHSFINDSRELMKRVKHELAPGSLSVSPINFEVTPAPTNKRTLHHTDKTLSNNPSNKHLPTHTLRQESPSQLRMYDPISEQKRLFHEQNERLDELDTSLGVLKGMSQQIGTELGEHVALLGDFNEEMANTESRLDNITRRTARLLHLSTDKRQWWAIGGLLTTLIIILLLLTIL